MPVNDNCYGKHLELKTCEEKLETFKIVRRQVNWDYPDERGAFFYVFWRLSVGWTHCLPDLHDYFQQDQIDWLIEELAESIEDGDFESLVDFIILTGYKDHPELDESGRPSPRRTTPIHRAAKQRGFMAKSLFKIFNRFDLNYADADGYTHLHVACQYGYPEIVEKFLEAGHDPNCVDRSTGNTPLLSHLSNINVRQDILRMLLESGADPNAANALGATPLHVIGTRFGHNFDAESLVDLFFRINDRLQRNVQIDARDNRGRSPLQCAVERLEADVVDALMARGAELTGLVFPSEAHFDGFLGSNDVELRHGRNLIYAAAMLHIVERFEERGYELNRSEAATVMKMFVKYVFNDKPPRLHYRPIVSYKPIRLIGDDETRFLGENEKDDHPSESHVPRHDPVAARGIGAGRTARLQGLLQVCAVVHTVVLGRYERSCRDAPVRENVAKNFPPVGNGSFYGGDALQAADSLLQDDHRGAVERRFMQYWRGGARACLRRYKSQIMRRSSPSDEALAESCWTKRCCIEEEPASSMITCWRVVAVVVAADDDEQLADSSMMMFEASSIAATDMSHIHRSQRYYPSSRCSSRGCEGDFFCSVPRCAN
ncbi:unnamed protein product [Trichogramma brassicae]|uniref:Ankyrin repeat domain-containing protein 54 n=1 Tax=Trichogramma brassicae TaxID=86971 RepID=A0A6H5IH00_9HYME|nr:unnamed protein product [Trichogramma brassicae]